MSQSKIPAGSECASGRGEISPDAWAAHICAWHERQWLALQSLERKEKVGRLTNAEKIDMIELRADVSSGRYARDLARSRSETHVAARRASLR